MFDVKEQVASGHEIQNKVEVYRCLKRIVQSYYEWTLHLLQYALFHMCQYSFLLRV